MILTKPMIMQTFPDYPQLGQFDVPDMRQAVAVWIIKAFEKEEVVGAKVIKAAQKNLPACYDAFWKELDFLQQKMKNRQDLKIEEIGVAALFTAQCYAWFCVGEIIGRSFTFIGYFV
ncbi:hypothetical protein L7F22_018399 [Adiantum nelumboides]|nr:hypothetical protein [Adiantum nelumboides]